MMSLIVLLSVDDVHALLCNTCTNKGIQTVGVHTKHVHTKQRDYALPHSVGQL